LSFRKKEFNFLFNPVLRPLLVIPVFLCPRTPNPNKSRTGHLPKTIPASAPQMPYDHEPFEYKITDDGFKLRYPKKWLWSPRLPSRLRYSELRFLEVSSVPVSRKVHSNGDRKDAM
jgi:hypothetical protein